MAEFITNLRTFASKAESVAGTAETLASVDNNVRVWDLAIGSLDVPMDMDPSKPANGDFGLDAGIPGPTSAKVSFTTKFIKSNSTTPTTEPNWTKFVKTAGCDVSGYSGALGSGFLVFPSKYKAEKTLSIGIYDLERGEAPQGIFYAFAGGIANCTISTEGTGKPIKMAWEYTCALNDISDVAESGIPVMTLPDSGVADVFLNGFMTIGGVSGCISTMELNFGNTVSPVECIGSTTGYSKFGIVAMEPQLTVNPLVVRNATYDAWGKFVAGTIEAIVIETSQFRLEVPRAQITAMSPADADGLQRNTLTFRPLRPTTADATTGYAPWKMYILNTNS